MLRQLQKIIYLLIILFLPTQLGKHFWPDFAYVQGIRIDYLSPTIYFTDVLIVFLFILWISSMFSIFKSKFQISNFKSQINTNIQKCKKISFWRLSNWSLFGFWKLGFGFFLLAITVGISLSTTPLLGLYGLWKLAELLFFGVFTARFLADYKNFVSVLLVFSCGVFFESFLAIVQFYQQGSVGGIFYFFGERTFTGQTPGIANASLDGQLVLRPYATLPHPNVLAGYLVIGMTFIVSSMKYQVLSMKELLYKCALVIGTLALFITMSRIAILLWVLIVSTLALRIIFLKTNKKHFILNTIYLLLPLVVVIGIISSVSPLFSRFTSIRLTDESVVMRKELIDASLVLLKENMFFGVGLSNFLPNLSLVPHTAGKVMLLQPVHNIFFLIAVETGIIGLLGFLWFLKKTYQRIMNQELRIKREQFILYNSCFLLLTSILILGLFDHYSLTLQQGQLLLAFVLGLCWANQKKKKTI